MRPIWRQIDPQAIRHNWRAIRRRARAKKIMAVVKSRGYGHGLLPVADALRDLADGFGVVDIADAESLRAAGIEQPILLMSGVFSAEEMSKAVALNLWTAAHCKQQVQWILESSAAGMTVFVKTNVGMNRLGFSPQEAAEAMDALSRSAAVSQTVLMAHFANSDCLDGLAQSMEILRPLRGRAAMSLSNSAGLLFHDVEEEWGRAGIALYGSSPAPALQSRDELGLRPAMVLSGDIIAVRQLQAGDSVGYGGEWRAPSAMRLGIAACGYGDGYPRVGKNLWARVIAADSKAKADNAPNILGEKAMVRGRVSMEMTALDLTACPSAKPGDRVIFWGDSPTIDEVASAASRISYELLTATRAEAK